MVTVLLEVYIFWRFYDIKEIATPSRESWRVRREIVLLVIECPAIFASVLTLGGVESRIRNERQTKAMFDKSDEVFRSRPT